MSSRDLIKEANKIPFHYLLTSLKNTPTQLNCPFAERHSRDDVHKSARYYPNTNRIYCFGEGKLWSPVSLVAEKLGIPHAKAAEAILKRAGGRDISQRKMDSLNHLKNVFNKKGRDLEPFDQLADILSSRSAINFVVESAEQFAVWGVPPIRLVRETAVAIEELVYELSENEQNE